MLTSLGIKWSGTHWKDIPFECLPLCTRGGEVHDTSGSLLYRLKPLGPLGKGTFAHVDKFEQALASGEVRHVALKRPREQKCNLLLEALFQWKLHQDLKPYGIQSCVPQVFSIFRFVDCKDAWFLMEAFDPQLLSHWCLGHIRSPRLFADLLLQIALILEVFEEGLKIDHRDLKVNNILVLNEPVQIDIFWKSEARTLSFPFRIVFLDFGFACKGTELDVREGDGIPGLTGCPNPGRDFFQILVSLWRIERLRTMLEDSWGTFVRSCIHSARPNVQFDSLIYNSHDMNLLYLLTDNPIFSAPLCTPAKIIHHCMTLLDGKK